VEQINFKGVKQIEKYIEDKHQIDKKDLSKSITKEMIKEAIESIIETELSKLPTKTESISQAISLEVPVASAPNMQHQVIQFDSKGQKQAEIMLENLVDIALTKSVSQAIKTSLKTKNAYLIDKLHDILIDKFYEILK